MSQRPLILFIGGHDPSGGAGLQADIETALTHGCRATSLVSCLTTQDSHDVRAVHPQPAGDLAAQLDCLLTDLRPDVVKIGLLGSAAIARAIAPRLDGLPLVLDPVLAAGGGRPLAGQSLLEAIREQLIPRTQLLTPNRAEARRLGARDDALAAARQLLALGADHVLLTGADEAGDGQVRHRLLGSHQEHSFRQTRLAHAYHGSGCTLAAACACHLARGRKMEDAVGRALDWTWRTLEAADRPGHGQYLPWRGVQPA